MFKKCCVELVKTIYCETTLVIVNILIYTFNVKETIKIKHLDSPMTVEKLFKVDFSEDAFDLKYVCRSFTFKGVGTPIFM